MNIKRFIESTNLQTTITGNDVDALIAEAKALEVFGVCVPPFWVKRASREIGDADLSLVTIVGFPLGYHMTETKVEEAKLALRDGANELDVVMNVSAFKDGMPWPKIEFAKLSKLAHDHDAMLKVIIEVAYLTDEEIVKAARLCSDAGVDFVKTSTGMVTNGGATEHHIKLLREVLPSSVGIKASGGIKTREQAIQLIEAGADRIGTSSAAQIVNG
tara:strand:+ start:347 stop:994 length:648 start_codon:yes stop_codon:yes gene_type:complete